MRSIYRISTWLHKWAGLILAIQLLLWIAGGVVMSVIPLEKVHGKHVANKQLPITTVKDDYQYPLDRLLTKLDGRIEKITYGQLLSTPIYTIETEEKQLVFDAQSGNQIQALEQSIINELALTHYIGDGELRALEIVDAPAEASGIKSDVWRADFTDAINTSLYFEKDSGALLRVRSDLWRVFDFFWMLHIMDYEEREDFNNPLLISFAISSLLFTLTGFVLLFRAFKPKVRAFMR